MPINPAALLATSEDDRPWSYSERDSILFALAVGIGVDPGDRAQFPYIYEGGPMRVMPTMANRMLDSAFLDDCGWDASRVVHAGERLELYRPLPPAADLLINQRVTSVDDLGPDVGARIVIEAEGRLARNETVLFSCGRTLIARGEGGFGAAAKRPSRSDIHRLPGREPDLGCAIATARNQALLFRLVDSMEALHVDAEAARRAGFRAPVLQGRCTFGIACHAILRTICNYDFTLITGLEARLTAPVYPGDTVVTEMWQDRNVVSFRCRVRARDAIVIDNGRCLLAG